MLKRAFIIAEVLERELKISKIKLKIYERKVKEFESKYKMDSSEFLKKFESGQLGDDEDFFVWWGYLKALRTLKERIAILESELQRLQ